MSAIISGVMIIGKITSGLISDYVGIANMTFIATTLTDVMCLAVWLTVTNPASTWAFAAMFGYFGGVLMVFVGLLAWAVRVMRVGWKPWIV
ncbi:uncharacterized protein B0P05DRAFT_549733, partial [Gilbertella persicaria]|uniref:uncharacterized protein n=1 Tax=Gilbertella persicaria TaxID=101096 RepID=UPI00221E56E7